MTLPSAVDPGRGVAGRERDGDGRWGYVVGVDLGGTKTRAALADADGAICGERVQATAADGGPAVVAQLAALAHGLAQEAGIPWERVRELAVGSPGVAARGGHIELAANISGLDAVQLAPALTAASGRPVTVENDANLAALGERWRGAARGRDSFAVLTLGTGVGLGLVVNGAVVRGARGAAGEVAFLPIGVEPSRAEAQRHGAFEVAAGKDGIERALRAALRAETRVTRLRPDSSVREVFEAAADGDGLGRRMVRRQACLIARAILAVTAIVDPELVVLAGGIGSSAVLLEPVRRELAAIDARPVPVARSVLGERSGVLGALALALGGGRVGRLVPDPTPDQGAVDG